MKKAAFIGIALLALVFWSGPILQLLLHALIILLEVLELLVDTILEAIGLGLYEAQAVTAWIGFGLFCLLLVEGLRRLNNWSQRVQERAPIWWQEEKARLAAMRTALRWPIALTALVLFLAVAVLL